MSSHGRHGESDLGEPGQINVFSAADAHTVAIKPHESPWMWGVNDHGQSGIGDKRDLYYPIQVMDSVATKTRGICFGRPTKPLPES